MDAERAEGEASWLTKEDRQAAHGAVITIPSGPFKGQLLGLLTLANKRKRRLPPFAKGTSMAMAKERTLCKQHQGVGRGAGSCEVAQDGRCVRYVPIEPAVLPLLQALHEARQRAGQ